MRCCTEWKLRLDLGGLVDASPEALMSDWQEVFARSLPKHLSRPLMVQILGYAYQLESVGGYTKLLDQRLKSAALYDMVSPIFKPRSRFVPEYHGITHAVWFSDDGRVAWTEI